MDLNAILRQLQGSRGSPEGVDLPVADTAETVHLSPLALLKMLLHGRAGVPMEVMGLMVGEFLDEYTVRVVDVFSMPQSGTGISVEAVDPEYQAGMLAKLELVGRPEKVVGWYHSHPGFGCWLSGVDVSTAQSFEQLNPRSVSVVVDPIQSVRGRVVMDAFRCIPQSAMMTGKEPRQTTSNVGFLNPPSIQALMHNLNRQYYSMPVEYRKNEHEMNMLQNVYKKGWENALREGSRVVKNKNRVENLKKMASLALQYEKALRSGKEEDDVSNVGKPNARLHLQNLAENMLTETMDLGLNTALNALSVLPFEKYKTEVVG